MKKLLALSAVSAMLLAGPALADDVSGNIQTKYQADKNGGYEASQSSTSTDANGMWQIVRGRRIVAREERSCP